jgi:hypothetical protein
MLLLLLLLLQICREAYPPLVCVLLWVLCEVSIVALDLTMVLGEQLRPGKRLTTNWARWWGGGVHCYNGKSGWCGGGVVGAEGGRGEV